VSLSKVSVRLELNTGANLLRGIALTP